MSNVLAIANVTKTLVHQLWESLPASGVSSAKVTATRPDDTNNLPEAGVNVFLYQVSPNAALRNIDLPTRAADGSFLRAPKVALDLYYLLTFYGEDATLDQQRLLGVVARQLEAFPTLSRDAVAKTASKVSYLNTSNLAEQPDLVRFTPINFSLEELSKLWSVFLKTDYVLSVAYQASVVVIDADGTAPGGALPVLRPRLKAVPFSLAAITSVQPQAVALSSPPAASQITLAGQNLGAADAVTFLTTGSSDPIAGTVVSANATQTELVVALPDGLRPGVNSVTLTSFSTPASPPGAVGRVIAQSNAATFVLRPTLVSVALSGPAQITAVVSPPVDPSQKVTLLLNQTDASPPDSPLAYELAGLQDASPPDAFDFSTTFTALGPPPAATVSVSPGSYLVRVRVDSAESLLETDSSGAFSGPIVTIP